MGFDSLGREWLLIRLVTVGLMRALGFGLEPFSFGGVMLYSLTLPIGTALALALMDWLYDNR